jgi:hypothetical protein
MPLKISKILKVVNIRMIYLDLRETLWATEIFFNESVGEILNDFALKLLALPGPHAIRSTGIGCTPGLGAQGSHV